MSGSLPHDSQSTTLTLTNAIPIEKGESSIATPTSSPPESIIKPDIEHAWRMTHDFGRILERLAPCLSSLRDYD